MEIMLDDSNRASQLRPVYDDRRGRERQQFIAALILFVVVAIIIGALFLVQATTNVGNARDIQELREQRDRLLRENEALRAENAQLASVPSLFERAATARICDGKARMISNIWWWRATSMTNPRPR